MSSHHCAWLRASSPSTLQWAARARSMSPHLRLRSRLSACTLSTVQISVVVQTGRQADRQAGRQTDGESGRQTSMVTDAFSQGSACWTKHLKSASPIARKRNQKAHLVLLLRTLPHTNAVMTRQSRHSFLDSCTNTIHITLTLHRG